MGCNGVKNNATWHSRPTNGVLCATAIAGISGDNIEYQIGEKNKKRTLSM